MAQGKEGHQEVLDARRGQGENEEDAAKNAGGRSQEKTAAQRMEENRVDKGFQPGKNKTNNKKDIVDDNQRDIQENANFLLYHYAHGSDYNTPFWEYARSLYEPCPVFNNIIEDAKKLKWRHMGRQYNYSYFSFPSVIATYCNHETKQDYKSLLRNNW